MRYSTIKAHKMFLMIKYSSWPLELMQLIRSIRSAKQAVEKRSTEDEGRTNVGPTTVVIPIKASEPLRSDPLLSNQLISNQIIINDLVLVILLLRNEFKLSRPP